MRNKIIYLTILFWLSFCWSIPSLANQVSAHENYSKFHVLSSQESLVPGQSMWLMFHLELLPEWYTYWQNPGDSGLPTKIEIDLPEGWHSDELLYLPPQVIQISDITDYGYKNDAYLFLKVTSASSAASSDLTLPIKASWVTCLDRCVPQQAQLELPVSVGEDIPALDKAMIDEKLQSFLTIQDVTGQIDLNHDNIIVTIPVSLQTPLKEPFLFLEQENIIENKPTQVWKKKDKGLEFELPRSFNKPSQLSGYVRLNETEHVRFQSTAEPHQDAAPKAPLTLLPSMLLAFLGGLLLNIMPCVFPILTLKIISLTKMRQTEAFHRVEHGLAYTSGIVFTFLLLAGLIGALQAAGHTLGWGFQMQSPIFLAVMAYVLFLVGCNLMGWINFIVPIPLQSKGPVTYSLKSSFYSGLLVTIIATPCTAPFMAPAIGFALSQPFSVILAVFSAMGLGLAFPFILFTFIPKLAGLMPRPGHWLITFKQALAFPMWLTCIWLLWLLVKITPANFVALVLIGLTSVGFYVWLRDTLSLKGPKKIGLLTLIAFMLVLPFFGPTHKREESLSAPFTMSQLQHVLNSHDKVLVNVTADWCITCKVNESLVFSEPDIKAYFEEHDIYFYKIDWTHPNDEVTQYLKSFNRSGVPLYVYYAPNQEPKLLPQLLTKSLVKQHLGD